MFYILSAYIIKVYSKDSILDKIKPFLISNSPYITISYHIQIKSPHINCDLLGIGFIWLYNVIHALTIFIHDIALIMILRIEFLTPPIPSFIQRCLFGTTIYHYHSINSFLFIFFIQFLFTFYIFYTFFSIFLSTHAQT